MRKNGIKVDLIADPKNDTHMHRECATLRSMAEKKYLTHIGNSANTFEVASSARTIEWCHTNWFYNRPVIEGFDADISKN